MTIAPAIYSLLMFVTGGLFGYLANLGRQDDDLPTDDELRNVNSE